jgi:hypothetical protein
MLPYLSWVMLNRKGSSLFVDSRPDRWKHTVSWSPIALKACKSLHTQWQTWRLFTMPTTGRRRDGPDGRGRGAGRRGGSRVGASAVQSSTTPGCAWSRCRSAECGYCYCSRTYRHSASHEEISLCVDLFTTGTKVTTCNPCEHILFQPA